MSSLSNNAPQCPIPIARYPIITVAHGGGGRLMNDLVERMFGPAFDNPALAARHDGAVLPPPSGRLAMTTDSYVVDPLFFPGGDIGAMAVNGTVNDLAMCGARPLYLTAGFIIEEGLATETLWWVVQSMGRAAREADVQIVAGDTKVVERGKGDGLFINTAGVGVIEHNQTIAPSAIQPGDAILLSGDVGRHGMAIMSAREGLTFETPVQSDCQPLAKVVLSLFEAGIAVHCLRDLTRGGLASALVEIAETAKRDLAIDEQAVPVCEPVKGVCEILGFDPLHVANEGRFVAFVPKADAEQALALMRSSSAAKGACRIGHVGDEGGSGTVTLKTLLGSKRILDMLSGEQLPRIC